MPLDDVRLTDARGALLQTPTGVNRRLLYLAAGDDVGCSLGLFWHKCDSFYLVDPEYGKSIHYESILENLAAGVGYLGGLKYRSSGPESGFWNGAQPGRRYQVWLASQPTVRKRLCFAACGSQDWLKSTNTHYNVVINKDYAGIAVGVDFDYPYAEVWGRLNPQGLYCETIGPGRSRAEFGFARYQFRGFDPLFRVVTDSGQQIGFNEGLVVFQKTIDANTARYEAFDRDLEAISKILRETFEVFLMMASYDPSVIEDEEGYEDLHTLMTTTRTKHWRALLEEQEFATWLLGRLPPTLRGVRYELLRDLLGAMKPEDWGSWT